MWFHLQGSSGAFLAAWWIRIHLPMQVTRALSLVWEDPTSVQFSHSVMSDAVTPWTGARQASLFIINSRSLLKLMSIEFELDGCPSNHLILCRPFPLLPSIFPNIKVFSNKPVLCIRWPKYCSFSFSISPSNEYSGPISFRIDWSLQSKGLSRVFSNTTVQRWGLGGSHMPQSN